MEDRKLLGGRGPHRAGTKRSADCFMWLLAFHSPIGEHALQPHRTIWTAVWL